MWSIEFAVIFIFKVNVLDLLVIFFGLNLSGGIKTQVCLFIFECSIILMTVFIRVFSIVLIAYVANVECDLSRKRNGVCMVFDDFSETDVIVNKASHQYKTNLIFGSIDESPDTPLFIPTLLLHRYVEVILITCSGLTWTGACFDIICNVTFAVARVVKSQLSC